MNAPCKEHYSERTGDRYYEIQHSSGLRILLYPKNQNNSTYAVFGTRYGSVDTTFRVNGEEACTVPEGIAHYLEHKLFESEDGDAFSRYAKTGASANAYTSFDSTCYLFSCSDHFYESLEILLDFVQKPYFTEETVRKEQGIIGQEIRMYDDDPQWRVLFNLLGALYHNHPVKIDIAGTVESIAQITPEYLYRCYRTFYNLHNMVLCIAGKMDVDKVLALCDRLLLPSQPQAIERIFENEPREVVRPRVEQRLAVAMPLFQLGFKEPAGSRRVSDEEAAASDVLLEVLASDASPLFRRLLDEGLINETSFSYEYFEGAGYASVIFSGDSRDPDRVAEEIRAEIEHLRKEGLSEEAFERARKSIYGRSIASLNSVESIANGMASLAFSDRELFHYIDCVAKLTKEDVMRRLEVQLRPEYSALSVVLPLSE